MLQLKKIGGAAHAQRRVIASVILETVPSITEMVLVTAGRSNSFSNSLSVSLTIDTGLPSRPEV